MPPPAGSIRNGTPEDVFGWERKRKEAVAEAEGALGMVGGGEDASPTGIPDSVPSRPWVHAITLTGGGCLKTLGIVYKQVSRGKVSTTCIQMGGGLLVMGRSLVIGGYWGLQRFRQPPPQPLRFRHQTQRYFFVRANVRVTRPLGAHRRPHRRPSPPLVVPMAASSEGKGAGEGVTGGGPRGRWSR